MEIFLLGSALIATIFGLMSAAIWLIDQLTKGVSNLQEKRTYKPKHKENTPSRARAGGSK